jgi:DNA-binding response OmpR family regulator
LKPPPAVWGHGGDKRRAVKKLDLVVGLLEDDADQAALVGQWLEESGYTVRIFRTAAEFRRRQGGEVIDLLLLDWMLPDTPGIDVIGWIRASPNNRLPVIFLTARGAEDDLVRGLANGGDDYVVKPAKKNELIARVNALLRRHGGMGDNDGEIDLPPYKLDAQRRRISVNGREIELTQREFDLARFLFRRQGRIVGRDALLENVWNLSAAVSTRTVDTHVSRLRRKLDLNGENGWRLAAIYQHGYRLEQV